MLLGVELKGKFLVIIGFGRIGRRVAEFGKDFDMRVIYYDVYRNAKAEEGLGVECRPLEELIKNLTLSAFMFH